RLATTADHRISISAQGARVALLRGPRRPIPVSISGPFRFAALRSIGRSDFQTGVSQTEVFIEVAWEPSFKAYYLELDPASVAARDLQGRALTEIGRASCRERGEM